MDVIVLSDISLAVQSEQVNVKWNKNSTTTYCHTFGYKIIKVMAVTICHIGCLYEFCNWNVTLFLLLNSCLSVVHCVYVAVTAASRDAHKTNK